MEDNNSLQAEQEAEESKVRGLFPVSWNEVSALWFEIEVSGLTGGVPLMDVCRNHANAILLLGRILFKMEACLEFVLSELEGGSGKEEIPAVARMLVGIAEEDLPLLQRLLAGLQADLQNEYTGSEPGLCISLKEAGPQVLPAMHPVDQQKLIFYLLQLPDGIQKMSGRVQGQAETACCLTHADLLPDGLHCSIGIYGSIFSARAALADKVCYLTEFLGGETDNGYLIME